jgi:hypothetical protein
MLSTFCGEESSWLAAPKRMRMILMISSLSSVPWPIQVQMRHLSAGQSVLGRTM